MSCEWIDVCKEHFRQDAMTYHLFPVTIMIAWLEEASGEDSNGCSRGSAEHVMRSFTLFLKHDQYQPLNFVSVAFTVITCKRFFKGHLPKPLLMLSQPHIVY